MVAGAKRASCWLACLAPLLCASKWFGEGCARVEDALVRPPKVILHPKSASPPKRWPSWPCLGWAVPHNRAFPRPILRRGLFHRPILRRGLCYARSREEGFVTPDPQNRALLRPIPTARDPDPDAPIPLRTMELEEVSRVCSGVASAALCVSRLFLPFGSNFKCSKRDKTREMRPKSRNFLWRCAAGKKALAGLSAERKQRHFFSEKCDLVSW